MLFEKLIRTRKPWPAWAQRVRFVLVDETGSWKGHSVHVFVVMATSACFPSETSTWSGAALYGNVSDSGSPSAVDDTGPSRRFQLEVVWQACKLIGLQRHGTACYSSLYSALVEEAGRIESEVGIEAGQVAGRGIAPC